jgi:hypothetical protein
MAYNIFVKKIGRWKVRMNSKVFVDVVKQRLKEFASLQALPVYRMTTQTWKEHDPKFTRRFQIETPNTFRIIVGTDDRIWNFLDQGTSIRWAIMSPDWSSKTHVDSIPATFGSGRVTWRGRNEKLEMEGYLPKPGIEARNFTKSIAEFLDKEWRLKMRYAVRDAARIMNDSKT